MTDETASPGVASLPEDAVLVHIGLPKTGSTALQGALFAARPELRDQGVRHAGRQRNPAHASLAVTGQPSPWDGRVPPIREWDDLVRDVRRGGRGRVVVSSEFLARADASAIARVVSDLGGERVHVVVTLRSLARILPSRWQQSVRMGRRIAFDRWLGRVLATGADTGPFWEVFRLDQVLGRWATEVGPERVTAIAVDEVDRMATFRTFEALLGVRPGTLRTVPGLVNRSLTFEEAEVVRAFNVAYTRTGLDAALYSRAMRLGAAADLARHEAPAGTSPIRLPAWSLPEVATRSEAMVAGIRATGVRVLGSLDGLLEVPSPGSASSSVAVGASGSASSAAPGGVPPEVAARLAMGIIVASGRARTDGAVGERDLAGAIGQVSATQLAAIVAARGLAVVDHRRHRLGDQAKSAAGLATTAVRRRVTPRRQPAGAGSVATAPDAGSDDSGTAGRAAADAPVTAAASTLPAGTIVLHIGPPKTGTTAIQAAFHAARDEAERQGVHYAGRRRHSITAVHAALGRRGLRREDVPPARYWHALRDEILGSRATRVVLSSEFFADATPERIRAVIDELGPDRVHVVVTLRPLARIIPSQWQQYVQSGMRIGYPAWLTAMLGDVPATITPSFWMRHRDDALIERWAGIVGRDRLTAIVLDEADHEMVLRTFERLTGLRDGTLRLQPALANRSLVVEEIEAVRALNTAFFGAGLGRALHGDVVNFGATEYLKRVPPEPGTTRMDLPAWAAPRVAEIAGEIADGIATSGVAVVGDLERLRAVRAADGPVAEGTDTRVPVTAAGRLAMGVFLASGLIAPDAAAAAADATVAEAGASPLPAPPGGRSTRPRAPRASLLGHRVVEPLEIARVPTGRLLRAAAMRAVRPNRGRAPGTPGLDGGS